MTHSLDPILDSLRADGDYGRGALDTLALLGLIRPGHPAAPAGKVAAMVIEALRAHAIDGVNARFDWDDLDGQPPRGVDFLRAIETARVACVDDPTPARRVEAAQAVFKTRQGDEDFYLMQHDSHAGRYQPIGGKREPGDGDLADTLRREIGEELGLPAPPRFDERSLELIRDGWVETSISATYGALTRYTFAFYHVVEARFAIKVDVDTCWLSRAEIAAGRAADGRPISPIYMQALGWDRLDSLPLTVLEQ